MLARLTEDCMGASRRSNVPERLASRVPSRPLDGEQHLEVSGPGETTYLQHRLPRSGGSRTPDFFALTVIDSLLTGPSSLNMFGGGGISNKTSRLYRALVEKELAVSGGRRAAGHH